MQTLLMTMVLLSLAGALFLLITDTASRCITASEIPAAILTSLIGAPLFLILLAKNGGLRG